MNITIETLIHGGQGAGQVDGKWIFVPFSVPGDELTITIVQDKGSYAIGQIETIVMPSPNRISPKCSVFGTCGGCQWQHIDYDTQLLWKKRILKDSLTRIAKLSSPTVHDTIASPNVWNYRNRVQLHIRDKKIGFYRPKSYEIVEFDSCDIAADEINQQLQAGRNEFRKRDRGIALKLSDGPSFAQINTEQNENLRELIVATAKKYAHDHIVELYAGGGNFTFALSKIASTIIACDVDAKGIDIANQVKQSTKVSNVNFIQSDAKRVASMIHTSCDMVILDPPRKGCADAIDAIASLDPQTIIYVSCNPATLARDIIDFTKHGYEFQYSQPLDMFPQTFHVESVNVLVKK